MSEIKREAAHTPGPWYVDEDTRPGMSWNRHIYGPDGNAVCFMAHSDGKAIARDEANAALIASAPDLAAEVERLRGERDELKATLQDAIAAERRKVEALEKDAAPTQAAADVLAERRRQVDAEGWRPEHDDEHHNGEMAQAAAFYSLYDLGAMSSATQVPGLGGFLWPWSQRWLKPKDRRHNLVRAAALLLAEIERLDRAALASTEGGA